MVSMDEDINLSTALTTVTPFIYRIGAANSFEQTATPDLLLALLDGGTTQYNLNTAGVWSLEDSNDYTHVDLRYAHYFDRK